MKIAVVSDELYPINKSVVSWLKYNGHEVILFGALQSGKNESWVEATTKASEAIAQGIAEEGIFFCWSGTGASIVANRFHQLRAALCTDAETARAARIWNHANVLVLSNRLLSHDVAQEILTAWFEHYDRSIGLEGVTALKQLQNHKI